MLNVSLALQTLSKGSASPVPLAQELCQPDNAQQTGSVAER
jgi:hypothetical protein